MDDLLEDFIAETRDNLETLAGQLVQWEQTPQDRALLDSVFRFVHTVKGSCGFLDLPRLLRLSHAAEDILSAAREGQLSASTGLVSAVLAVVDRISALTDALETGQAVFDNDDDLIDAMLAFLPKSAAPTLSEAPDAFEPDAEDAGGRAKARTVRVSLALLDKLMNGVSDMVLARNEVSRQLRKAQNNSELDHAFARLSASVAEMRDAVGMMRMQNIDRLFSSLPRLLRDIAIELGKEIELQIDGSEVEVDREMVEALRDPLTHILRNAADHGIETAQERRALGKDPVGQIRIVARQSGNQILIEIIDDGRGINLDKLGARAIANKIVTPADWQKMGEKAQLNTIFIPGLSTADQVSAISGRGVGMDVVKNNLQAIGGTVDLENYEGQGLKMTLRLPLTLSIIAGLSVRAGDQIYGISRNSVVEILSSSNRNVRIEEFGGTRVAYIRGERYPYGKLESLLEIEETEQAEGSSRTLIVIRPAVGATFVLDVANVIDNEELVVKPGAPIVMETGLFAGTTLPDNGRPMLLLDASGLGQALGIEQQEEVVSVTQAAEVRQAKRPSALLYVSRDGVKRAIRLSVIDRMEDVDASQIKHVGGCMRASIGGKLFDVCDLEQVPAAGMVKLLRLTDGIDARYLAVEDVIDIFTLDGEIAQSACPEIFEGVVSAFGETVELVNVYRYFEAARGGADSDGAPLCFIEAPDDAGWEERILAPLLAASGYRVSFDATDRDAASVILSRSESEAQADALGDDGRILRLRDSSHAAQGARSSIYRYDRVGLLSAIEAKISGVA
jgi:two-component system, chemotaxis family, sensor kinase CheA